ncbi:MULTISPECIES: hypothetical protein [unclassified Microcoleus]
MPLGVRSVGPTLNFSCREGASLLAMRVSWMRELPGAIRAEVKL